MKKPEHPVQPLYYDSQGVVRFKPNAIVAFLIDWCSSRGVDMNALAIMQFSKEDEAQFAQLIGYSLSGFGDLSYVTNKTYEKAAAQIIHGKKPKVKNER